MTRSLTRTNFHSSRLSRCLAELALVETVDPGNAFAERLGQWIHVADAISLSTVHQEGIAGSAKVRAAFGAGAHGAAAEFDHVQGLLLNSITKSFAPKSRALIELPKPEFELPLNPSAAYVPYRRFYEAHQRDMDMSIQPLRYKIREAVAQASPGLKKLAELDETFEKILRERESKLLGKLPILLKKRFEQLFKEHQRQLADAQQADDPAAWPKQGGWLAHFYQDMQNLLLAELELRLQPAMGLLEAFKQNTQ